MEILGWILVLITGIAFLAIKHNSKKNKRPKDISYVISRESKYLD